ncbi:MAG TPA: hypothetical protein VD862_00015 [Candidatus Paceibacterota bacterium]|nr:hypothetical protein [Candidatus Paceibacterota bacterium]
MPEAASYRPGEVIVQFAEDISGTARLRIIAELGHAVLSEFRNLDMFLVSVPVGEEGRNVARYNARPEVLFADLNYMGELT